MAHRDSFRRSRNVSRGRAGGIWKQLHVPAGVAPSRDVAVSIRWHSSRTGRRSSHASLGAVDRKDGAPSHATFVRLGRLSAPRAAVSHSTGTKRKLRRLRLQPLTRFGHPAAEAPLCPADSSWPPFACQEGIVLIRGRSRPFGRALEHSVQSKDTWEMAADSEGHGHADGLLEVSQPFSGTGSVAHLPTIGDLFQSLASSDACYRTNPTHRGIKCPYGLCGEGTRRPLAYRKPRPESTSVSRRTFARQAGLPD